MADFLSHTYLSPGYYSQFRFTRAEQGLSPLPLTVAMVGIQTGTEAKPDVPEPVVNPDAAAARYGQGCELALMLDKCFETTALYGQQPRILAVPLTEPSGAGEQPAIRRIALAGTATEAGIVRVRIGEVVALAGAATGDDASTIAPRLVNALGKHQRRLPVQVADAGSGNLDATHLSKGVNGNDVVIEVLDLPPGITASVAETQPGVGQASLTNALANLLAHDINGLAFANHSNSDLQAFDTHATAAWGATQRRWRHGFFAHVGNNSHLGTLIGSVQAKHLCVLATEGAKSLPAQIAAAVCTLKFAATSPVRSFLGYDKLPLVPPEFGDQYTPDEIEEIHQLGGSPLVAVGSRTDRMAVNALNSTSLDEETRTLSVSVAAAAVERQIHNAVQRAMRSDGGPPRLVNSETMDQIRDVIVRVLRAAEAEQWLRNVAARLAQLAVGPGSTSTRIAAQIPLEPTPELRQVLFDLTVHG
ncbi:MAG: hypothetical protein MJE77_30340 [Proteobacteria bacterium]|nr:hypothetical protein [Pseudomonadota bacterium]